MSEETAKPIKIFMVQPLLLAAMTLIVLALTGKTFYDVMSMLRTASAENYHYREVFRLQEHWRIMVRKIGPIKKCEEHLVEGEHGKILLGRELLKCEIGKQDFMVPFPDEFSLCPVWDEKNGLLILQVDPSAGTSARPVFNAALRLVAVINGGRKPHDETK